MADDEVLDDDLYPEATRVLSERDPVIAKLVDLTGPVTIPRATESNFTALVRAITYQQLAGSAARAIFGRLAVLLGEIAPERLLAFSALELQAVGLSRAKAVSVLDLAAKVLDGTVAVDDRELAELPDQAVIDSLVRVKGIGPWTAEIFLMIHLRRIDVLPAGDLGVRKGFGFAWNMPTPSTKELIALGDAYRPYRSVLAWYCWRADELYGAAKGSAVTGATPV
jgi:DNA-3-methyladenine glycosylase II